MIDSLIRKVQPGSESFSFHRTSVREAAVLIILSVGVGLASGLSSIVLNLMVHETIPFLARWHGSIWMVLLPAAGAALSAIYLGYWVKDGAGHGVPEVIRSTTVGRGFLRRDMIYSRLVSSFLTVSSGGSAGLEGPIVTSGGAIGSAIGAFLKFNERRRVLLVGYGVAGAISAIFNAPITGSVFALEVILGEWSTMSILPTLISAVTATQLSRIVLGNQIAFPHEVFAFGTMDLFACVFLGAATGLLSVAFARGLSLTEHKFTATRLPVWIQAMLGGLLVGGIGYFMPTVLHDGYESIQKFLSGSVTMGLAGVVMYILLKFLASLFTLGSGGSGGTFAPSLVLGSATGFGFGLLLNYMFPGADLASNSAYGLVGMSGMVAGLMHAPLTGMFLALEVTGGYRLILPLMITSVMAMLVSYYFDMGSIYTRDLKRKGFLARKGSDMHLLRTMEIRELIDSDSAIIYEDMLLRDFVEIFKTARRNVFPVVERESEKWLGVVYLDDIRPYLFEWSLYPIMTMGEVMHQDLPVINSQESALSAIQKFESSSAWSLPVVEGGKFMGMMSKSTLFDRYRNELLVHTDY